MSWVKRRGILGMVDSKIVERDYVIATGFTHFNAEYCDFDRDIRTPAFYLFKVHKNHPLRIFNQSNNFCSIWPADEPKKGKKFRMPAEVVRDKMDYDLSTFLLVPSDTNINESTKWQKIFVERGFEQYTNNQFSKQLKEISLIYANHGFSINSHDGSMIVSEVMSSQILNHFFSWLNLSHKVYSHDKSFNQRLEGRIQISSEQIRELTYHVGCLLEKRYNTRLMYDDYKKYWRNGKIGLREKI